ncbi:related to myosin tail region-interacting protein MTI1 [Cephalotrichum gorgonifer]|uniref:Related to myosin tail region-interacting protein MTI1 n=1 Tax=Cephalotrichum gorgonifer TaxID=2041049 RepID=A0AAE8N5Q3_9PEZI|nr:related to myosin tail region-interacting protein MTI1 [Cephalotrichum gorgonifer]
MPAASFHVKALFEYASPHDDDLQFGVGQIITVTDEDDEEWYTGEYVDDDGVKQEGIFPRNFVEKYEPTAPPRPARRAKKEPEQPAPVPVPEPQVEAVTEVAPPSPPSPKIEDLPAQQAETPVEEPRAASPPPRANPAPPAAAVPQPPKEPAAQSKPGPPPVAAKSGSIRDRIAAFNKPGGGPVTPFKPSSLNYVKKPFVPAPPSRDAYVPPPRAEPPPRMYVREVEADTNVDEPENQESADRAAPVASASHDTADATEDQPKPTSLQERIALLQRQQAEAAQRHADAVARKEKPKRPPKKRAESSELADQTPDPERAAALERRDTEDTEARTSLDEPRVAPPSRRRVSKDQSINDGNEADMSGAGDTTEGAEDLPEREGGDDKAKPAPQHREKEEEEDDEDEDEEEDDYDPEVRRKEELRARMAKMSGGMGMPGMFMPMAAPPPIKKKKPAAPKDQDHPGIPEETSPASRAAPPIPTMMALPGMSARRSSEQPRDEEPEPESLTRAPPPAPPRQHSPIEEEAGGYEDDDPTPLPHSPASPPPAPGGRPAPPPVPTEAPALPRPVSLVQSPSAGSESDDELSEQPRPSESAAAQPQGAIRSPPLPPTLPSPTLPTSPRFSTMPPPVPGSEDARPTSPTSPAPPVPSKRNSRPPPPIPGAAPALPPMQTRPPPPPPPGQSRDSKADEYALPTRPPPAPVDDDEEVTEYEGDYDTDITSSAPHKDALKSTSRDASYEDDATPVAESSVASPPPLPSSAPPRAVPPPVPSQAPPRARQSVDVPRTAPPPPPPAREAESAGSYSSYDHGTPATGGYPFSAALSYGDEPTVSEPLPIPSPPLDRRMSQVPPVAGRPLRQSMDVSRVLGRTSVDVGRSSIDSGFIAEDIDLALQTGWWSQSSQVPPVLQGRKDITVETEETTSTNRGAKTVITRTISILFIDYSKTIITVQYDPYDPSDTQVDQRHEPPPRILRQDQLESSHDRFGRAIADMASSKKESVVGDGTAQGLVHELLRPFKDALRPVGTRAFGALVYANMANASTLQHDEIRAGDIISFRNTRFQGKHGPMHAKYSAEVGKPDHVAIVAEWDGTKKKVRAWEQGRESKKVKMESFKLDDLRSGEVKVWRVMPRSWVGWSTRH